MSNIAQDSGSSLVFFALGAAGVPPRAPLPGPVLVRLLGDLGLSEGAARSTILRMRQAGWLTSAREGRTVGYAPSAATLIGHRRHAEPPSAAGSDWDGSFHALVVRVPERRRRFRDAVRRAAAMAGYRGLRPGLLIAPSDRRAEIAPVLDQAPKDVAVLFAQLRLSPDESRAVAAELWELDALAQRYRDLAIAARNAAAAAPGPTANRTGGRPRAGDRHAPHLPVDPRRPRSPPALAAAHLAPSRAPRRPDRGARLPRPGRAPLHRAAPC